MKYRYVCDDGEVLLPRTAKHRSLICNLLQDATTERKYVNPTDILNRFKNIANGCSFEYIRSLFLDIFRWFSFRKNEFISSVLFHEIRKEFIAKQSFFGRIYSRILRREFKFSECYKQSDHFSTINYYVKWNCGNIVLEEQCLNDVLNARWLDCSTVVLNRLSHLIKAPDVVDVLSYIFGRAKVKIPLHNNEVVQRRPKLVKSTGALWLLAVLKGTKSDHIIKQVHDISHTLFHRFIRDNKLDNCKKNLLNGAYLSYGHVVVKLIRHISRLVQSISIAVTNTGSTMNHLHYEESNTTSDELFVLQLLAKQELFRRNHDVNILLSGLYDMVRYLEIKKCAPSSSNELRAYLEVLMQSVCIPFFRVVVRGLSFDRNNFKKIIQILQTITEQYKGESHEFYFPRFAVEKFTSYGMSEFCVLLNYEKQKENNLYDAFAILKGEKHTYLYRFGDGSFVASTDTSFMDHWNIYRSCSLVGSVRCQLVIKPYSSIAMDSISQYVDILKRRISSEVVAAVEFDNVVNIHFPRNTSSCTLSRFKLNVQKDLIQHPIHKYIAIMIE